MASSKSSTDQRLSTTPTSQSSAVSLTAAPIVCHVRLLTVVSGVEFQVSLSRACLNDLDTFIKFQVWDLDHTNGHKLLGSIETSLREQQQFSEAAARKSKA